MKQHFSIFDYFNEKNLEAREEIHSLAASLFGWEPHPHDKSKGQKWITPAKPRPAFDFNFANDIRKLLSEKEKEEFALVVANFVLGKVPAKDNNLSNWNAQYLLIDTPVIVQVVVALMVKKIIV